MAALRGDRPPRKLLFLLGKFGRSERIRTSDPLLPKQVRYQTALRSDRWGVGYSPVAAFARGMVEEGCGNQSCRSGMPMRCIITLTRGMAPVSGRLLVASTGRFSETLGVPSRRTM